MEQPINILIVDDEPKNLTVLETVLDDPGYRLVRAESADQALLALVVEEFALLILDIRLPGMTGFELAQMIKERKKTARVPIIFLTAYYNEDQHVLAGYETGAVDYLHKPVNPAIIRSKVAVFAELHRKSREIATANRDLLAEVSERRRAEERLRELNDTLEQRVTERTQALALANANLKETNERYRSLFDGSLDAIISLGPDGCFAAANPAALRLTGRTLEELKTVHFLELCAPEQREAAENAFRAAVCLQCLTLDTTVITAAGERRDLFISGAPAIVDGEVVGVSCIGRDVTERKRAEAALRDSEERLRLAQDAAQMGSWDWDMLTGEILWSPHHEIMWGYEPGTPRRTYADFHNRLHPEDGARIEAAVRESMEKRTDYSSEYRVVWPDSSTHWVSGFGRFHFDSEGRPVRMLGMIVDITARKQAEQALKQLNASLEQQVAERTLAVREREDRLRAILNTAADAIITIDAKGIIQSVNAATEQIFGYTAAEMIGQNVKCLMPSPHREEHDGHLANYARTRVTKIMGIDREVVARRKDGSTFPADLAISEVGHLKLYTGILRDITRRKELEREVVEIASLEQRRIGQDLHDSVGQELTALNILAGDLAETLRTDPANGAKLAERMARGLKQSQRELRAVMQGLLPVAVDSEGLMAALSDLAGRTQQQGKAACTFDCSEPVSVADNLTATHLYLIAQEAVRNAVKHAQPRNIRIELESNGVLLLRVQDDGIGMPAQPAESHNGIGLRIMQNRAVIVGATLTIQPADPTGTLVTCTLLRKSHER